MAVQTRPEPMNASPYHSKVRVSLRLADPTFVAGALSDKGLGISLIMIELVALEELTSRNHSATSTFFRSRRLFQGPGLPPSNAVRGYLVPGDPPLPENYYPALRGVTTFLFQFSLPESSPSAIDFGSGLAHVKYELRATVGFLRGEPEGVVVGENGKIWAQGKIVGGFAVAGQPTCVELQVKNHSSKKNTGLSVSLTRELFLPNMPPSQKQPLQISDTLTSVSFRGPEYIIQPGVEGVANLVFDLPKNARGVKGGTRQGDKEDSAVSDALFEVRCLVNVKLNMGIGSPNLHPLAVPALPPPDSFPLLQPYNVPIYDPSAMIYSAPTSPAPYMDRPYSPTPTLPRQYQGQVWLPPPQPYHSFSPPPLSHQYYYPPPVVTQPLVSPWSPPPRPSSAEPLPSQSLFDLPAGLPSSSVTQPLIPLSTDNQPAAEREEGKGGRASRISMHLRMSSRHRSTSPPAHRYSVPSSEPPPAAAPSQLLPGSVVSPRPMLSPKRSFSDDPFEQATHVQTLERIAARLELDSDAEADRNKTLPAPPVPTGKQKLEASPVRTRAETLFPDGTPPTPTLAAVTSLKVPVGLDALEAKLLAEVGTRKAEKAEHLALPGLDADTMTLRMGRAGWGSSDLEKRQEWGSRDTKKSGSSAVRKDRHGGRRVESIPVRTRSPPVAQGSTGTCCCVVGQHRPDLPPQSATPPSVSPLPLVADLPALSSTAPGEKKDRVDVETPLRRNSEQDVSAAPNPRSSGFAPMSTLRANTLQRAMLTGATAAVASRLAVYPPRPLDSEVRYDIRSARGGRGGKVASVAAIWASATQQAAATKPTPAPAGMFKESHVKLEPPIARKTIPPKLISHTPQASPDSKPTPCADVMAKRARMNKSSSVPAAISSSLATPMLSSTASLARPSPPLNERHKMNIKLPPTIPEGETIAEAKSAPVKAQVTKGELAFGQARLRELIKRYQGQTP
ncbi:hypothetical protein B0H21DRAFT_733269 [Amylocystis lapponica]|nr:hypothetical protein B0H21DRAFT_733269 [Amylocystis lapponica]